MSLLPTLHRSTPHYLEKPPTAVRWLPRPQATVPLAAGSCCPVPPPLIVESAAETHSTSPSSSSPASTPSRLPSQSTDCPDPISATSHQVTGRSTVARSPRPASISAASAAPSQARRSEKPLTPMAAARASRHLHSHRTPAALPPPLLLLSSSSSRSTAPTKLQPPASPLRPCRRLPSPPLLCRRPSLPPLWPDHPSAASSTEPSPRLRPCRSKMLLAAGHRPPSPSSPAFTNARTATSLFLQTIHGRPSSITGHPSSSSSPASTPSRLPSQSTDCPDPIFATSHQVTGRSTVARSPRLASISAAPAAPFQARQPEKHP